nr:RNA-directed DNA polymerase, eukaryota, reverse transcriptase zinc-binding domain protein [Tanacetum cinerariifolium]
MGAHNKNSLQSKADQTVRISKSIFVSNFPDGCTAKDLWKVCNDYGTVVDVFIPNKKSKAGKRFSFVRFIKAEGQFQTGSYVNVVNGSFSVGVYGPSISSASVLVLDDSCIGHRDLSNHIMGKVKAVSSISNLRTVIMEEGFSVINLVYLGGLWVMIECDNVETKANMKKWGEALDIEDNVDLSFGRKRLCIKTKLPLSILESFKVKRRWNTLRMKIMIMGHKKYQIVRSFVRRVLTMIEEATVCGSFQYYRLLRKQPGDDSHKDYVSTLIDRWNGEVVVLGDFNEVQNIDERCGSCFNPTSARVFDQFISASGLVDVKNGRVHVHLVSSFEADFGPIPFWFYHSWISLEGFDAMVEQTWRVFVDGIWCTNPNKVKEAFFKHFEARFKKPVNHRLKINFLFSKRLSDVQASDLERKVSRDEIRLAVWNCGENKSPGPDGYSFEFFRKYWNVVGSNLCDAIEHFFETGSFLNGCNSSFVALISKITDAKFVNDFWPISLIGSVYKVVTKVLANRLALEILDLISDTQSAFVANRQILDGPFILNELLHWCKRKKKQVMFFKVGFAKAYDSVRWDYLLVVVEDFGFGVHLHGSTSISHLFYADDVMFIGEWSDDNLKGVGVPSSIVMQATSSIGCGVLHKQFRYLGVMVGECMSRHNAWASTMDKLRSLLSKWKVKTLSIGGRLTLLKAFLGTSPI